VADPGHREGQAILIAAFGNKVEIVVSVENALGPTRVSGISVEDIATLILVEDGDSWGFRAGKFHKIVEFLTKPFRQQDLLIAVQRR
jgi:hypothetical protein